MRLISKNTTWITLPFLMIVSLGCSRSGNTNLDRQNVDMIVEGRTTGNEILTVLGTPETITTGFRKSAVDKYLRTKFLIEPEQTNLAEDDYEIWSYWYAASGSVPIPILGGLLPKRPVDRKLWLIINSQRVCVYKVYEERGA